MRTFLESVWDIAHQLILWFTLIIGFFIGLFLMGFVTGFFINIFMAGFRFL